MRDVTENVRVSATYQHTDADIQLLYSQWVAKNVNSRDEELVSAKLDWKISESVDFYVNGYYHDWDTHYTTLFNSLSSPGTIEVVERERQAVLASSRAPVLASRAGTRVWGAGVVVGVEWALLHASLGPDGGRGDWWHSALHTFDFSSMNHNAWSRNSLMLTLLLGAAAVYVTGTWLGIRRPTR